MTLWDVDRLFKHWLDNPPPGDILRAIAKVLGIEFRTQQKQYMTAEALKAFVDATGGRIDGVPSIHEYRG